MVKYVEDKLNTEMNCKLWEIFILKMKKKTSTLEVPITHLNLTVFHAVPCSSTYINNYKW